MKYIETITSLLGRPQTASEFELYHQFKLLRIEISKLEKKLAQTENERMLTENLLNSTIKDLKDSSDKIRSIRRRELMEKDKELQFKAEQLSQITDSLTSSMCYMDRNYIYRYVNYRYEQWFGHSKEEVIGKTGAQLAPELFRMFKPIYDSVMSGERYDYEFETVIPRTGERMVFKTNYVPAYNIDGKNIGLYIFSTDITDNKMKEEQLVASKRELNSKNKIMEQYIQSNLQLEQFAHIAAHDMKAPLRTITSFAGILEKKLADRLDNKEKNYFDFISQGTKDLSIMVSDLLQYSKVKSQGLRLSPISPCRLVNQMLNYLKINIDEKSAVIILGKFPEKISGDKGKLSQVFQNLISNAIKFSEEGKNPIVNIDSTESENHWIFSVADNGIGIDDESKEKIFEPFKQLSTKQKYQGTGLGLSICKRIIEDHGGTIDVKNRESGGSKFVFSISKYLEINSSRE